MKSISFQQKDMYYLIILGGKMVVSSLQADKLQKSPFKEYSIVISIRYWMLFYFEVNLYSIFQNSSESSLSLVRIIFSLLGDYCCYYYFYKIITLEISGSNFATIYFINPGGKILFTNSFVFRLSIDSVLIIVQNNIS